ncbi:hypothetical protein BEL07_27970 [Mycolicibacterium grossiae]|uniref:Phosphohydrolase-associated domain-containing protein n=1 Tax=Mycolicibacterium grossiae TaxID=1552759 RepID=A0A1E8PVZ9_9MYCO|nr:hypothetical protein BEL07_27970 [Mycolicibacterium grossiae]
MMKQFVWYHVIDEPRLSAIQRGQRRVLRDIFEDLLPMVESIYKIGLATEPSEREKRTLPYALTRAISFAFRQDSHYTERQCVVRGLIDFLSGLSDAEAYTLHSVLKGREGDGFIH